MTTTLSIQGDRFCINGQPTYQAQGATNPAAHGLLMNGRFIQGIFDDAADPARFARFGWDRWDPERHTDELIAALPQWHRYGVLALTVGLQGGMPVFTTANDTIDNNPFSEDGTVIDGRYLGRLERLIAAADRVGMVIIVSFLYQGQAPRLRDARTIRNGVVSASRWLGEIGYRNVILEVANEQEVGNFRHRPLVNSGEGMAVLIDLAREHSGGLPVGCSGGGGTFFPETAAASDVVLIHGNGLDRAQYYAFVQKVRAVCPGVPIVCNEDSPCYSRVDVAAETGTSWGYYNNLTKQEPPADWSVSAAEDRFFAERVARAVGLPGPLSESGQARPGDGANPLAFLGFDRHVGKDGTRWLGVAALYPEWIDRVEFHQQGRHVYTAYEEPFYLYRTNTWTQRGLANPDPAHWHAVVHHAAGQTTELRP